MSICSHTLNIPTLKKGGDIVNNIYINKYGKQFIELPMFNGCYVIISLSEYKQLKELKYDSFNFTI